MWTPLPNVSVVAFSGRYAIRLFTVVSSFGCQRVSINRDGMYFTPVPEIDTYGPSSRVFVLSLILSSSFRSVNVTQTILKTVRLAQPSELFALANGPSMTPMSVKHLRSRWCEVCRDKAAMVTFAQLHNTTGICALDPDEDNVFMICISHGESTEVDAHRQVSCDVWRRPMILAMCEDPLSHDLAESDVEDLINDDDVMLNCYMSDGWMLHEHMALGDGGGEDPSRPLLPSFGCRGKRKAKAQFGRREARQETGKRSWEPKYSRMRYRKMTSATQEESIRGSTRSIVSTPLTVYSQDPEALPDAMIVGTLEATVSTPVKIQRHGRGGKLRGHNSWRLGSGKSQDTSALG
ncbi:hypothetical protein Tco_1104297 [Tanacetum coccineum]